ncbi:RNA polymerase sigma factor [Amycolatopsis echigonensis]|uniref:Sigma-70 family RNA polymerase sigma factor n=1 Tax=Amycolatopsis echigonensis TaxID=2576905 RepID=A0A8E2B8V2_9PSEU|nr:sigma-70 family RNA polymerase sigma factor [Amycolatopsis echigonensis]MBB2506249.1 sigma-70 family RNA polymerase sigma factor [Amycolatopsis echigonensis]
MGGLLLAGDDRGVAPAPDVPDRPAVDSAAGYWWRVAERARAGDRGAFAELYERHVDSIFGYILVRTGDRTLTEEFTSETFLRALRRLNTLTYRGTSVRAWLMTIARNLILDDAKSARRRYEVFLPDDFDGVANGPDPASAVCGRVAAEELRRRMLELTAEQRECLYLRFFEHLEVEEVAQLMRRSNGSVRQLQLRAVRRLGALMAPELFDA